MSEIIWTGSPDDQTARIGDYVLRVEEMDRYYWWWAVSHQGEEIDTGYSQIPEQGINSDDKGKKAKTACEKAYYEHLKTNL